MKKKLDGNYTRMLRAILNKFWRQHPTKPQLYGYLPAITKTIQVRRTRHAGHWWKSKDKLISDVFLWIPSPGLAKLGRPPRTYLQQLYANTRCSLENLPVAMDNRDGWRERGSRKPMPAARHDDDDKHLGILEVDTIKQEEMKEKLRKNISGQPESYSRQNYITETLSKEKNTRAVLS